MHDFDFVRPQTVSDAVRALATPDAQALSGGQTLLPAMKVRLAAPAVLVSLMHIPDMVFVRADGDVLRVGGATTHAQVAREAAGAYPALASLAARIGDPAVRSRGTIGGSLANNDPSACYPAGVLASNATIVTDRREIGADDFFQGMFTTALEEGEIVVEVRFPIPDAARYEKFIQPASRFPLTAAFVARHSGGARVAITGASESGVFRWHEAEVALTSDFAVQALDGLAVDADGMIADLHGSSAYRAHLAGVMTRRAVAAIV
ncbi:carbon monoxide dehydrogenase, medium subunit [Oceaniovalibus guishaninsula JLT2003]|uniref:Carbon monoxide dehydrogenase, medium subunit n=1 Tax=Oceaniovalibus guishaninsula JLT2003 TaxID=1231392 RepID=K2GTE5_9RHOB|nr:FAD binding domain-containing protein [Oceaniovalibus guishaninsula]EKE45831.1 carbon monoxide dehydrogenase, medium subunit [Oceaniovalibus guishaninsula JLT2003]